MTDRHYTVSEIETMRAAIRASFGGGSFYPAERAAEIEQRLRTYMQNGTAPDELVAAFGVAFSIPIDGSVTIPGRLFAD